jgi:hypothetical protein
MLNHLPVVGSLFALGLLAFGIVRKSDPVKKAALGALVIVAALSIPAYLTGEPSEDVAEKLPGVSHAVIEEHEDAAKVAFVTTLIVGGVSLAGLVVQRSNPIPQWFAGTVLALSIATVGALAWTANLGGQVRHTEIRTDAAKMLQVTEAKDRR